MGTAEIADQHIIIRSHIITYGNAANPGITEQVRDEIETMWNDPAALITWKGRSLQIVFSITASFEPAIDPVAIYENTDPRNNYFRFEEFVQGKFLLLTGSGVTPGISNLENLYKGSTTTAHEYGHSLGLYHPIDTDLRGKGIPGIMYPRGTLVDAQYQYNPLGIAGDSNNGGTMHPKYRKVFQQDINLLGLHKHDYHNGKAVIGEFTSIWHPDHAIINQQST